MHSFASGADALQGLRRSAPSRAADHRCHHAGDERAGLAEGRRSVPAIRVLFVSGYTEHFIVDRGVLKKGSSSSQALLIDQLAQRVREILDGAFAR